MFDKNESTDSQLYVPFFHFWCFAQNFFPKKLPRGAGQINLTVSRYSYKKALCRLTQRFFAGERNYFISAMSSTSQRTFFGRVLTATQERAGLPVKYLP